MMLLRAWPGLIAVTTDPVRADRARRQISRLNIPIRMSHFPTFGGEILDLQPDPRLGTEDTASRHLSSDKQRLGFKNRLTSNVQVAIEARPHLLRTTLLACIQLRGLHADRPPNFASRCRGACIGHDSRAMPLQLIRNDNTLLKSN